MLFCFIFLFLFSSSSSPGRGYFFTLDLAQPPYNCPRRLVALLPILILFPARLVCVSLRFNPQLNSR